MIIASFCIQKKIVPKKSQKSAKKCQKQGYEGPFLGQNQFLTQYPSLAFKYTPMCEFSSKSEKFYVFTPKPWISWIIVHSHKVFFENLSKGKVVGKLWNFAYTYIYPSWYYHANLSSYLCLEAELWHLNQNLKNQKKIKKKILRFSWKFTHRCIFEC